MVGRGGKRFLIKLKIFGVEQHGWRLWPISQSNQNCANNWPEENSSRYKCQRRLPKQMKTNKWNADFSVTLKQFDCLNEREHKITFTLVVVHRSTPLCHAAYPSFSERAYSKVVYTCCKCISQWTKQSQCWWFCNKNEWPRMIKTEYNLYVCGETFSCTKLKPWAEVIF